MVKERVPGPRPLGGRFGSVKCKCTTIEHKNMCSSSSHLA